MLNSPEFSVAYNFKKNSRFFLAVKHPLSVNRKKKTSVGSLFFFISFNPYHYYSTCYSRKKNNDFNDIVIYKKYDGTPDHRPHQDQ